MFTKKAIIDYLVVLKPSLRAEGMLGSDIVVKTPF